MKVIDGDLIELSGNHAGLTGRRMKEIWNDLRATLDDKAKSYTLDTFIAQQAGAMYHI